MATERLPDLTTLSDTPVSGEAARLAAGEAWFTSEIAGLQFYDYGRHDADLDVVVMPAAGDLLHLVREPANEFDANAIQVHWRNGRMLGHLPRMIAYDVAPLLDSGLPGRAYVLDAGDGDAWSLQALVVGRAAEPWHERWMRHVVHEALTARPEREVKREKQRVRRAERTATQLQHHRTERLRQAVGALLAVPFEPTLPAIGETVYVCSLSRELACSESTVKRIAARAGIVLGQYASAVTLTPEFADGIRAWAQAPRSRIDPDRIEAHRIGSERPWRAEDYL